ncbi:hypothetical protein [Lactobacillus corticis]|uniref:Uncharacterized protein n=1 Tax=Lactobacillus corticis TaxID=2201249 RepID=A0A916QFW5_9LACO|nr:hypothetical protein [Lactobacillus corticis]GFZ26259.1 hypothetical protein LCB40_01390 [Lactobacillus corticis]
MAVKQRKDGPSTTIVIIGILLMVAGVIGWVIEALKPAWTFLFPLSLLLICLGGLTLTIAALVSMIKRDRRQLKAAKEAKKDQTEN